ncbi:NAD(P)-dependent alcohol dehydrogenase [Acidovorax sp. sif1233]|uniref:zinc-dependent alcohol dehydrogenase family protein n=1 Tax=Acidovorax sp. sif1233 TaxID=2854792 RepID=UPI001C48A76F|nr:NAD(P)-dependent alcohol dehydrogenase [Acidovorax sp. sif1233]MBV7453690.1 NAD(P)-dependent alcohol dehydrogenase [Acidovorax sp. sif1233]
MHDTPATLQRWQLPRFGLAHLERTEAPMPAPGPSQILVRTEAVALNYRDLLMAQDGMGMPLEFPFTPASDLAGTVLAVGAGITRWRPGDRVLSTFWGGWLEGERPAAAVALGAPGPGVLASHMLLEADWAVAAPATLAAAAASTLPIAGLTAWFALVETGHVRAGQAVLIHGTGGVALFGVQIARQHGAVPIVVSGDAGKREQVLALGAAHALAREADWPAQVRALTGGQGADHVLETVGGPNLGRSMQALRHGGRVSVIGTLAGDTVSASVYSFLLGRATVQGIGVGHRRALEDLVRAVDATGLQPVIAGEYGADEVPAAFAHLQRGAFGKVVVRF